MSYCIQKYHHLSSTLRIHFINCRIMYIKLAQCRQKMYIKFSISSVLKHKNIISVNVTLLKIESAFELLCKKN